MPRVSADVALGTCAASLLEARSGAISLTDPSCKGGAEKNTPCEDDMGVTLEALCLGDLSLGAPGSGDLSTESLDIFLKTPCKDGVEVSLEVPRLGDLSTESLEIPFKSEGLLETSVEDQLKDGLFTDRDGLLLLLASMDALLAEAV